MKIIKTSAMLLALLPSICTFANANEIIDRNTRLDSMMYTISKDAKLSGPILKNTKESKDKYGTEMIRILLNEAHKVAYNRYYKVGDTKAYYAFLTLALTVPLHEGLYIQFRETNDKAGLCDTFAHSGNRLFAKNQTDLENKYTPEELVTKKSNSTIYNNLVNYLMSGDVPFIANCNDVKNDQTIRQVIRGADGSDLTMMQLSIRWHDTFFKKKNYLSMEKTVNYGLKFLMDGFRRVYSKKSEDRFSCMFKNGRFKYNRLIRGTWAGKYNSGNYNKACRFANTEGHYAGHDKGFLGNLEAVLNYDKATTIGISLFASFEIDKEVMDAVRQVVHNHKNYENNRSAINKVIK
jgi:uncharacterized protein (UPF0297 family)